MASLWWACVRPSCQNSMRIPYYWTQGPGTSWKRMTRAIIWALPRRRIRHLSLIKIKLRIQQRQPARMVVLAAVVLLAPHTTHMQQLVGTMRHMNAKWLCVCVSVRAGVCVRVCHQKNYKLPKRRNTHVWMTLNVAQRNIYIYFYKNIYSYKYISISFSIYNLATSFFYYLCWFCWGCLRLRSLSAKFLIYLSVFK